MAENNEVWSTSSGESSQILSLEDEIYVLRTRMEQLFLEEQSFTSELVIEISMLLDLKINEYMRSHQKR
ncbi:aspartyl-phosphate phosphatase Spo0E family protein [Paenibacillus sp. PK4536]|uniref:aspartyl-phosphate phosphatase Spo0E family protein n=1 Tax=Paenibacillus TaxID=44249 RepID=UPI001F4F1515|nr:MULTISPECIES: aspartyl-phosphate phosphatase Spo0E family protein [Paenibacillus]WIM41509.1 aspartyl-phosphate phosphatase Spo0E family protein [Paenibacillus sp. PK4536]